MTQISSKWKKEKKREKKWVCVVCDKVSIRSSSNPALTHHHSWALAVFYGSTWTLRKNCYHSQIFAIYKVFHRFPGKTETEKNHEYPRVNPRENQEFLKTIKKSWTTYINCEILNFSANTISGKNHEYSQVIKASTHCFSMNNCKKQNLSVLMGYARYLQLFTAISR